MARSLSYPIIALLALPLAAQTVDNSYPRVSLFYGTAPTIGSSGLQKVRESVLIGLEYSHPVWKGQVSFAAEWRQFRSRNHEVTQFSPRKADGTTLLDGDPGAVRTGYTKDGQRGYITAFTRNPIPNASTGLSIASDMRFDSVHMAKYDLDGGTTKLSYRQFFPVPLIGQIGVHGGLTINFLTAAEYATGSIIILNTRSFSQNSMNTSWTADNFNANQGGAAQWGRLGGNFFFEDNKEIKVLPGAYVGVRAFVKDNYFFETNLALLTHAQPVYVPQAYTGQPGHLDSGTKAKVVWEFLFGIRF